MKYEKLDMTEFSGGTMRRKDFLRLIPISDDLSTTEKSQER